MRVSQYSDFLNDVSALIGVQQSTLQSAELTLLNSFFNRAIRKIWEMNNWPDLSPYGEVRWPVNLISLPNDLTATSWTLSNTTATETALANPLDNRVTASKLLESTSATTSFSYSQTFSCIPNTQYAASGYARPNGRNFLIVSLNDSTTSYQASFALNSSSIATAITTSQALTLGIQTQANGFYYWSLSATSASGATGTGSLTVNLSADGVTTTYAGSTSSGIYSWGVTVGNPNSLIPAAYYIPWEQNGEAAIDVLFDAWSTDPGSFLPPYRLDYAITSSGIELIGPTTIGPVYTHYRYRRPLFQGNSWSSTTAYTSGQTFQFTSSSTGYTNYYTVGSAGSQTNQSPDTNPSLFSVITIPYIFLQYCVWSSYADWLEVEGQTMKAQAIRSKADDFIADETDRMERQQGVQMPWKVYTHLTSQNRGLGYVGQNFNAGTATIN